MNDADACMLDHFWGVRAHTIELVERIPASVLEETPAGETEPLRWQFVHIADGPDWWMTHVMGDGGAWSWPPPYAESREGLLQGLAASRDRVIDFFEVDGGYRMAATHRGRDTGEEWSGRDRVLYLTEHEVHHRGRIVLALAQRGFEAFPGDSGDNLWPAAGARPRGVAGAGSGHAEAWTLVERLMESLLHSLQRLDALAPAFPEEMFEARDTTMEGMQVADYMERLVWHNRLHRDHVAGIRASIGRARPTGPDEGTDPVTGEPYTSVWYRWFLANALEFRAELAAQLIGLRDEDLDRKPDPMHTATSTRTIREVCEHVLACEAWQMRGITDALEAWRRDT